VFPLQFVLAMLCGWLQRQQEDVIAFLREENRVLKARLEGRRLRLMTMSVDASPSWAIAWAAGCWPTSRRS
jgi:hypothetical protein